MVDRYSLLRSPLRKSLFDYLTEDNVQKRTSHVGRVDWIEKLAQGPPISDGRACVIERAYFIRRMSKEEVLVIIKCFPTRCLALPNARPPNKKYDGYVEYYLDYALKNQRRYSYLKLETS